MVLVLKKGASKKEIDSLLKKLVTPNNFTGLDARKYCGTIKLKQEPIAIQKQMRDEWERYSD